MSTWGAVLDMVIGRRELGLPDDWCIIRGWADDSKDVAPPIAENCNTPDIIHKEIPLLDRYDGAPGRDFWKKFPKFYPEKTSPMVNVKILEKYVGNCWDN